MITNKITKIIIIFLLIIIILLNYLGYRLFWTTKKLQKTQQTLNSIIQITSEKIRKLEKALQDSNNENQNLLTALNQEKNKNNLFQEQIQSIQTTVQKLDKLSKTDRELLQKYSKVYFLNENYIPNSLSNLENKYLINPSKTIKIHSKVKPFLTQLIEDATDQNLSLKIVSAYRSFEEQKNVKTKALMTFGSKANQFIADQGYSEHQLGTTVDFTTPTVNDLNEKFENTPEYKWLTNNAHKYGFILSYPKNNKYYQFEPWHWRFVGIKLATKLYNAKQNFYDLDQREINQYLISIFE
jgi:D-alanyl-D-alanine carboxypeptidase